MRRAERYSKAIEWFRANAAGAASELHFDSPYQLIVAVILSAQCTDRRVNMVTPALFEAFPDAKALAAASEESIFNLIRSVSYPNNKARHLKGMASRLISDFGGEVPGSVEELMTLPGVGRKTANVVASIVFNEPVIAVDTHVYRVSRRIGLSGGKTPFAVEKDLEKNIPEEFRAIGHHWLILHGRYVCTARKPHCSECGLRDFCAHYEKKLREDKPRDSAA